MHVTGRLLSALADRPNRSTRNARQPLGAEPSATALFKAVLGLELVLEGHQFGRIEGRSQQDAITALSTLEPCHARARPR